MASARVCGRRRGRAFSGWPSVYVPGSCGRTRTTASTRARRSVATRNPVSAARVGDTGSSPISTWTAERRSVASRLPVRKTYKLFIGGAFPRSESGRTYEAEGQNVARASRTDVRDSVRAARSAQPKWAGMTAYNRGQVLYRLAEMVEARTAEFAEFCTGREEVERTVDRIVWYAGWADKLAQILGSANPVAGPYFNFTVPEPTGVVAVIAPDEPPLLGLVSRVVPALTGADGGSAELERAAAENVKRVVRGKPDAQSPWEIAAFLELKTVWHPVGQ